MEDPARISDFFPVPCCFPTCRSITYLLADEDDVVPIPRFLPLDNYLDYITNRALPDPSIRSALEGLWSASAIPGSPAMLDRLSTALAGLGLPGAVNELAAAALETCASFGVDFPEALTDLAATAFTIVIQDFKDPYTLNVKQLMKCCVVEITRGCCVDRRGSRRAPVAPELRSDCSGEFVERSGDGEPGHRVDAEFVVAAPEVLHEGVAGDDDGGGAVAFEAAHRPESGLEATVVGFDTIVGVLARVVNGARQQFDDRAGQRPRRRGSGSGPDGRWATPVVSGVHVGPV